MVWNRRAVLASLAATLAVSSARAETPPDRLDADLRALLAGLKPLAGGDAAPALIPGRPVVLSFVATWCAPCWLEMYTLARLAENVGAEAGILAVNQLEDWGGKGRPRKLPLLLERGEGRFPVVKGDGASGASFAVTHLPFVLVYDHTGMLAPWQAYRRPPINRVASLVELQRAVALAWE